MDWFEKLTGFRETDYDDTRAKPHAEHKELYANLLTRQGDLTRRMHAAGYL